MHRNAPTTRRSYRAAALAAAATLLLAGCGGAEETAQDAAGDATSSAPSSSEAAPSSSAEPSQSPAEEGGTLAVTGVDFDFELESTELTAGEYEVEFTNDGDASHDVVVELDGEDVARSEVIGPGQTSTFTVALEPGEYIFYCSVGNHRGMGMEVEVTVT